MNRALLQLVDSRGPMGRLVGLGNHHNEGAADGGRRIGCEWPESGGLCGLSGSRACLRGSSQPRGWDSARGCDRWEQE